MKPYEIYQLDRDNEQAFRMAFMPYEYNLDHGSPITKDLYKKVYAAETACGKDIHLVLDNLFMIFNTTPPEDFHGHTMSVSDVVVLDGTPYYCDSVGWKQLTEW